MAGAEDDHFGSRQNGLDKDFEFAAADQAAVRHGIFGKIEGHDAGFLFAKNVLSGSPDFRLDTAATDGSQDGTVVTNQHFGRLKAGDRATDLDDGGKCSLASGEA